jgi:hypothetical protein
MEVLQLIISKRRLNISSSSSSSSRSGKLHSRSIETTGGEAQANFA